MIKICFQIVRNICLNQQQGNERESYAMEYRYLRSDFGSTLLQIEAVVCSLGLTQLASECVHSRPEGWNTQSCCPEQ